MSFPAGLCGRLSSISVQNFMILAWTLLEKFHPKSSEAVFSTVFPYNFWPEVDNDIISGTAVDNVGMYVHIQFGDSRSNGLGDIRGADSVSNERTLVKPIPIARNAQGVSPKKRSKLPPLMALGRISGHRFKRGSQTFTHISGTANLTNLPDMSSLAAFGRLQNAIKYCTKVRQTGAAGIEVHSSITVWRSGYLLIL